ncbi:Ku protein [Streptomyces sp. NPDC059909]|uniref:non-homologous end joining protein Ku n=1 Tax=Streptomyces sp. NPDC059909 TaxID=3346998 RepID=UPI00364E9812
MPRPVWSGAISFGLVTIPIKLLPATEDRSVRFRQIHIEDQGPIRYKKVCDLDGKELSQAEIAKGYELPGGDTITITDEELETIPLPTAKAIDIQGFVPAASIDPIRIGDGYYLAADGPVAAKPYTLLRKALERSSKVAVAKMAFHGRERLGLLRTVGDAILIHMMRWPDEVRSSEELTPPASELGEDELEGALALMDTMSTEEMPDLHDEYRESLEQVIAAKTEGREPAAPAAEEKPAGQVVDLMAALNASVAEAKERRGDATVHEMPKKKTAAKKTAAKKTAKTAKKTPAKKTSGRKPRSA